MWCKGRLRSWGDFSFWFLVFGLLFFRFAQEKVRVSGWELKKFIVFLLNYFIFFI